MNEEQMQKLIDMIDNLIENVISYESEEKKNELRETILDETKRMFVDNSLIDK